MASRYRGTIYTGSTTDLVRRVWEHRERIDPGCFTARYGVTKLVFSERHEAMAEALVRERLIKRWQRAWKFALIEATNPEWHDLWWQVAC